MIKLEGCSSGKTLNDKETEDLGLLANMDAILVGKRGYVVRFPKPGATVCAALSGGLDSTLTTDYLMRHLGYRVHGYFVNRGQRAYAQEKRAMEIFSGRFASEFPLLWQGCKEISIETPPPEIKGGLRKSMVGRRWNYPARNTIIALVGLEYMLTLREEAGEVSDLFFSSVADDESFHNSLTWTRVTNVSMCQLTNLWGIQFICLAIEREFRNFFGKPHLLKYASQHHIPWQLTRTCTEASEQFCGNCRECQKHAQACKTAGIADRDIVS